MWYVLSFLGGYLVGSIPTAFLVVRKRSGIDIREAGSGNVGGFNAFNVTKSRYTGFAVGIIDGVKGLAVAVATGVLMGTTFWIQGTAILGAIVGHNYPVWLRFKGGRGLATTAGCFLAVGMSFMIAWCLIWWLAHRVTKDILESNVAAIVVTPVALFAAPRVVIAQLMVRQVAVTDYLTLVLVVSTVLLLSHWKPAFEAAIRLVRVVRKHAT